MKWISVKEQLPELRVQVLATDRQDVEVGYFYEGFGNYKPIRFTGDIVEFPTHWSPIPELPETEK